MDEGITAGLHELADLGKIFVQMAYANMVFQLLLAKERDAVPVNRNFIVDAERAMKRSYAKTRP